jgi:hypothetical protein
MPCLGGVCRGICLTSEEKHVKTSVRVAEEWVGDVRGVNV